MQIPLTTWSSLMFTVWRILKAAKLIQDTQPKTWQISHVTFSFSANVCNANTRGFLVVNILKTAKAMEFVRQAHTTLQIILYMIFSKIKGEKIYYF